MWALDYPGTLPGKAIHALDDQRAVLANEILRGEWALDADRITALTVSNQHTGQSLRLDVGHLPRIVLDDGRIVDLAILRTTGPVHLENNALVAAFKAIRNG